MPEGSPALPSAVEAALALASRGIPVFPCDPATKKPLTPNGFKNATTDPGVIWGWWRTWPHAMIAVATGEVSCCFVLDIDQDQAKAVDGETSLAALVAREGPLPETAEQITPRGGRHLFFAHPGRKVKTTAGKLGPGLDVRGDGGYIVVAPSVNAAGGAYRWRRDPKDVGLLPAPEWLLNLVAPPESKKKAKGRSAGNHTRRTSYAEAALKAEIEAVTRASRGERNDTLNRAAFSLGQLVGGGLLDRTDVEQALRTAAADLVAEDGEASVEATTRSGLEAGIAQPRGPDTVSRQQSIGDWYSRCLVRDDGQVFGNLANVLLALREDTAWTDVLGYDEMLRAPMLIRPVPVHGKPAPEQFEPRPLRDEDVAAIQEWLQIAGLPTVGKDTTHQAVDLVAREQSYHPVRDYLDGLIWDGTPRLALWLHKYLGSENTEYTRGTGTMFMISMVARIYDPGCKVDYMVIFEGPQGVKKSTVCAILGDEWFSDNMPENVASKDASQHIRGKWVIELGELHALSRSETTALKAFITRRIEICRRSYGRKEVHEPRQVVFVGTTNKRVYLRDETGGRRFWPVKVGAIEIDLLKANRDQLFAEAVIRYRDGQEWWPSAEFEANHIMPEQEARFEEDAWEEAVESFLLPTTRERTTILRVAREALNIETPRIGTVDQRRIAAILERLGWSRAPREGKARWWVKVT